jgi:hypothetical protein
MGAGRVGFQGTNYTVALRRWNVARRQYGHRETGAVDMVKVDVVGPVEIVQHPIQTHFRIIAGEVNGCFEPTILIGRKMFYPGIAFNGGAASEERYCAADGQNE